jgi:hypothetical protein
VQRCMLPRTQPLTPCAGLLQHRGSQARPQNGNLRAGAHVQRKVRRTPTPPPLPCALQ